jgi:transcriptional/translational regulatory protein YebC/TACO1
VIEVLTGPDDFASVLESLQERGFKESSAEVTLLADATVTLDNEKTAKALRLIDRLEDIDDVQSVSTNLEIPDDYEDPEV